MRALMMQESLFDVVEAACALMRRSYRPGGTTNDTGDLKVKLEGEVDQDTEAVILARLEPLREPKGVNLVLYAEYEIDADERKILPFFTHQDEDYRYELRINTDVLNRVCSTAGAERLREWRPRAPGVCAVQPGGRRREGLFR